MREEKDDIDIVVPVVPFSISSTFPPYLKLSETGALPARPDTGSLTRVFDIVWSLHRNESTNISGVFKVRITPLFQIWDKQGGFLKKDIRPPKNFRLRRAKTSIFERFRAFNPTKFSAFGRCFFKNPLLVSDLELTWVDS